MPEEDMDRGTLVDENSGVRFIGDMYPVPSKPVSTWIHDITIAVLRADPHKTIASMAPRSARAKKKLGRTRLDFTLSKLKPKVSDGDNVRVTINLDNDGLKFLSARVGGQTKEYAVTVSQAINQSPDPTIHDLTVSEDRQLLTFFVKVPSGGIPLTGIPFNLGLVVTDDDDSEWQVPMFYDPKVQNDG